MNADAGEPARDDVEARIAQVYREEWARIVAGLTRRCGDLDLAEEMAAEAFASAVERWPGEGLPPNPGGWITTTAYRKAIDRLRRESFRDAKQREALMLHDPEPPEPTGPIEDDRLRLLFTCCHPVLSLEARVALTLRIVGGLTVEEIARAFLMRESAVRQRITRAKAKIKTARIPYQVPAAEDLRSRVDGVLAVLYLVFNEGYFASGPELPALRGELTAEAIRLTRLVGELLPGDTETAGLLALMLLSEARSGVRLTDDGELIRLGDQDRGAWDRGLIAEGLAILDGLRGESPGRYELLARINAVHVTAAVADRTDWARIVELYERLERIDPSPVVTLNRAIALAERDSPESALVLVDSLRDPLEGFHAFHMTRAELLRAAGRPAQAVEAYDHAIALAGNAGEIVHLTRRRDELAVPPAPRKPGGPANGESR
ncbi:RNA polymerase sigma factor [Microbacterium sp. SD291]|uniref:RNA polymerase sigma factor n=1 Tax=Microbacterium sp. SD291 TaxID=2782007 RepID=UPI001A966954|nr:sigma-70 family RNA polymerase sigma factor [Microbacterium sp. SD291]MBO0980685.1 sigma-70 family RNA polymerase sigma factor [Microbacterium sp. SD291]